ncbi:N-myc-interactor-like isoform X2 [Embiotoca jacksoni]|uniref:N-myc-interactor-like isoform X2 n=1 Tax=Embiotoca jacksoni TaxID=100190 RepID=UPI003704A150
MMNGDLEEPRLLDEARLLEEARKELETWKTKVEKAQDMKDRLILEKLDEDDIKTKAQQEMMASLQQQEDAQKEFKQSMSRVKEELLQLSTHKEELQEQLRRSQKELQEQKEESERLRQKFKIYAQIPETEVKFIAEEREEGEEGDADSQPIRGVFTISQRAAVLLHGGQALVTFEEEKVASQILKIARISVSCDGSSVNVKPKSITMDPAVKFEVHLDVSRKELKVSNVPPSMPEERMKDRLEMSFSRPSRGGGEVKSVEYKRNAGTGLVSFLHPGVADSLALAGTFCVVLDSEVNVQVGPVYEYQLRKFQTFCGAPKRTVLLDGIEDTGDEEELQDHLEIHFQKPSNSGGEIESLKYVSGKKTLLAFFGDDMMQVDN